MKNKNSNMNAVCVSKKLIIKSYTILQIIGVHLYVSIAHIKIKYYVLYICLRIILN